VGSASWPSVGRSCGGPQLACSGRSGPIAVPDAVIGSPVIAIATGSLYCRVVPFVGCDVWSVAW
jgi:hypothetical protein